MSAWQGDWARLCSPRPPSPGLLSWLNKQPSHSSEGARLEKAGTSWGLGGKRAEAGFLPTFRPHGLEVVHRYLRGKQWYGMEEQKASPREKLDHSNSGLLRNSRSW